MLYHRKAAVVLTAVLAAALLFALPAMAGGAITDVSRLGCVISVTYTAHDMGSYNLEIYDNGAMIASYPTNAIGGTTVVAQHVITAPLADSSVGLTLILKGSWGEILDGFNGFVFSNEVAHRCAETGGSDSGESVAVEQPVSLPCPIPSGSVVGDMPFATSRRDAQSRHVLGCWNGRNGRVLPALPLVPVGLGACRFDAADVPIPLERSGAADPRGGITSTSPFRP
jgi:hypothetical protein